MAVPDIYDSFKGKNIFFTGVTGFVGKVFLYKLLKEFPDMGTIYCLCRPKKGVSMEDRFAKEVLSSPAFLPIKKEVGEEEWKRRAAKCRAVPGDITHHRLGLSDADYDELAENVNIIVHMAATVDFQEKLNVSCEMNVLGSIRVMALGHRCKNLESYIHTSTCYVNWNRHGGEPVKEQLYNLPFDVESMLKLILSQHDSQIPALTEKLLTQYRFPNTYTFTKAIGEHLLMQQRGNLPFVIVRPAIIGCSWKEPYCGWVDALTAAGGIFLVTGLGLMHDIIGDKFMKTDVVPCDHVVNLLLKVTHRSIVYHKPSSYGKIAGEPNSVSPAQRDLVIVNAGSNKAIAAATAANGALRGQDQQDQDPGALSNNFPRVYQSSTSSTMNPLRWATIESSVIPYWNNLKHPKAIGKAYINFYDTKASFLANFYTKRVLPVKAMQMINAIPGIHDAKKAKLLKKYDKAILRVLDLNKQFQPFTSNTWQYDSTNSELLESCLSPKAQAAFNTDVFDINWFHYGEAYSWGLIKFIMKDNSVADMPMPPSGPQKVAKANL